MSAAHRPGGRWLDIERPGVQIRHSPARGSWLCGMVSKADSTEASSPVDSTRDRELSLAAEARVTARINTATTVGPVRATFPSGASGAAEHRFRCSTGQRRSQTCKKGVAIQEVIHNIGHCSGTGARQKGQNNNQGGA